MVALGLITLGLTGLEPVETITAGSALLVVIAYEAGLTRRAEDALYTLEVEREPVHTRALEGEPIRITLRIRNPSSTPVYSMIAREELPPRLRSRGGELFRGAIPAGGRALVHYEVIPAPGLSRIEHVEVEAGGPLGLYRAKRRIRFVTSIQAYPRPYPPPPTPTERLGLLETLRSRRRGWSLEFYSLREYTPGDDVRLVAWLPSARVGRLVVRENTEVRTLDVCVFLDLSLESWAGAAGDTAADWISRVALGVLEASARLNGSACYLVFTGETFLRGGPGRASDVEAWLAEQISSTSPLHCRPRRMLSRFVSILEEEAPRHYVTLYLLGPGALPGFAEALEEARSWWRMSVVEVLPSGDDAFSAALRRAYSAVDQAYLEKIRGAGIPAYIASTPGAVALAVKEGLESVVRRASAP